MGMNPMRNMEGHNLPPDAVKKNRRKEHKNKNTLLLSSDLLDETLQVHIIYPHRRFCYLLRCVYLLQDPHILSQVAAESGISISSFLAGEEMDLRQQKKNVKDREQKARLTRMDGEGKKAFHRRLKRSFTRCLRW